MKLSILCLAVLSFSPLAAYAQNLVESESDHPSPNCYAHDCVCPKNYSIRNSGTSSATGGVGANCEYDGLRSGGMPDNKVSRVQGEAWTSSVDPIGGVLDGYSQSGAVAK